MFSTGLRKQLGALNRLERALVVEALTMAASRHESQSHVTKDNARYSHSQKAEQMRRLRDELERDRG